MISWLSTFALQQIWSWLEENWGLCGVEDSNTGTSWSLDFAYVSSCLKKLSLYHIPQVSPVIFLNSGFCPKWKERFCYPSVAIVLAFLGQVNVWRPLGWIFITGLLQLSSLITVNHLCRFVVMHRNIFLRFRRMALESMCLHHGQSASQPNHIHRRLQNVVRLLTYILVTVCTCD